MKKSIFIIILALFFSACSSQTFFFGVNNNELHFKVPNEKFYTLKLATPAIVVNNDSCSMYSYTLNDSLKEYGNIFIEDINLHSNCQFNTEALGAFMYEFKEQLHLKSLEKVEEITHQNYEFSTYKVNDTQYMNVIYIYSPFSMTFIVDYDGKLHNELLMQFDAKYTNGFITQKRFDANYHYSLVKMNLFKHYFNVMSEDYSE